MTYGFIDTAMKYNNTIVTNMLTLEICGFYDTRINYKFNTCGSVYSTT